MKSESIDPKQATKVYRVNALQLAKVKYVRLQKVNLMWNLNLSDKNKSKWKKSLNELQDEPQ